MDGRLNVVTTPGVTPSVAATPGDTVPGPCRITPLALPSGAGPLEVTGADPSGRYVMPTLTPARWDLRTGEVELLAPQTRGQAVDGNPAGDVIVEDNGGQRVLLHDGRRVTLDAVAPTAFLKPAVVGDTGLWLVGTQYEDANSANGKRIPVLWRC